MTFDDFIERVVLITLSSFLVGLIAFVLVSGLRLATLAPVASVAQTTTTASLGDQLIFPDGWTPVACDGGDTLWDNASHADHCGRWVCVKDSVYRYCTPTIVQSKVEATEEATR